MKNLKLILATAVVILALSACQKPATEKPVTEQPSAKPVAQEPSAPSADLSASCASSNGNWLADFKECENAGKEWCDANKGTFNECASACRHNPKAEVCTMNCVPVCSL